MSPSITQMLEAAQKTREIIIASMSLSSQMKPGDFAGLRNSADE
jgi:hypothetical protein